MGFLVSVSAVAAGFVAFWVCAIVFLAVLATLVGTL